MIRRFILLVFLLSISINAVSGGTVQGKVDFLQIGRGCTPNGVYVLVKMNSAVGGQAACATDQRLALDPSTELGKVLYSTLLSAKHTKSTVEVFGGDSCSIMGTRFENISYIRLL